MYVHQPSVNLRLGLGGSTIFSPLTLFAAGEQGTWYDPSDLATLFQDSAGTIPVTASGDLVGKIVDKSGRGNHATQGTTSSKPIYRDVGGLKYLEFDGVDDFLATATIDFSATGAVTTFSGLRKLVSTQSMPLELSSNSSSFAGSFLVGASGGGTATYFSRSNGSTLSDVSTPASYAPPITNVVVTQLQIATDTNRIRVNGAEVASGATDQGAGNYGAYPLYFGRRGGTTQPFTGYFYGLIVRGADTTDPRAAEQYLATKSGVTF